MRFDLPPKRHWRMLSGYCDTGKMAFENLPFGVSSHVSAGLHTQCAVRCACVACRSMISVSDWRSLGYSCTVNRRSIQSLANEVGCTRTHLSLVLNGKRNFTEWMSSRCLDAIQFDTEEAQELVGLAGFITKKHIEG